MSDIFPDTRPEAGAVLMKLMREASPERKVEMLRQLNAMARAVALEGLRARYPGASEAELWRRLADLLLGPELAARVYGPVPYDEQTPIGQIPVTLELNASDYLKLAQETLSKTD